MTKNIKLIVWFPLSEKYTNLPIAPPINISPKNIPTKYFGKFIVSCS